MNFRTLLLAVAGTALLLLSACTSPDAELDRQPDIQGKTIAAERDYYGRIPRSTTNAYHLHVTRYTDGSVHVTRNIVPASPDLTYSSFVAEDSPNMQPVADTYQLSYPADGWRIPFDPNEPVSELGFEHLTLHCDCYGYGTCSVSSIVVYSNGAANFYCESHCDETCIERVEVHSINAPSGGALFLSAPALTY